MVESSERLITKIRITSFKKRKGKWQFAIRVKCREKCTIQGITLKKGTEIKFIKSYFRKVT